MTSAPSTERRLRDALAATATLVDDAFGRAVAPSPSRRPAQLRPERLLGARRWHRGPRWAPAVLAAAVVVLVVGLSVVAGRAGRDTPPAAAPTPYFIANVSGGGVNEATVRDATTGTVTAVLPAPRHTPFWGALSGTADPHVFFMVESRSGPTRDLYRLTIDDAGRMVSLVDLGATPAGVVLAASPDATRIAFPGGRGGTGTNREGVISVLDIANRRQRTLQVGRNEGAGSLSWDASGRYLAFQVDSSHGRNGLWILDTHAPAAERNVFAASRRVLRWADNTFIGEFVSPVLSADARHLYVIAAQQADSGDRVTRVVELDAHTGKQTRVLFERPFVDTGANGQWGFTQLARDPTGRALLVIDQTGHCYRIDVGTKRVTRFPFPRGADPNSMAW